MGRCDNSSNMEQRSEFDVQFGPNLDEMYLELETF